MENYRALYKTGKTGKLREEKRETALREQKKKREDTFLERRNIRAEPEPQASTSAASSGNIKTETRREKLLRWKAEKDKLIAQQKLQQKKRPPFKVGVAHHAADPKKELVELHATAVKCTTAKKVAASVRAKDSESHRIKPTQAATSLAALAAPVTSAFSGRVTRSRTAAAADSEKARAPSAVISKAPATRSAKVAPAAPKAVISKAPATRSAKVAPAKSVVAKPGPSSLRAVARSDAATLKAASKPTSAKKRSKADTQAFEESFAPKDHKFKAPANLTLPTTPLTLKRKAAPNGWLSIPGIGVLSKTPGEPSPKNSKPSTVASQRRGRLSRAVKEKTPRKSTQAWEVSELPSQSPVMLKPEVATHGDTDIMKPEDLSDATGSASQKGSKPSSNKKTRRSSRVTKGKENLPSVENDKFDSNESLVFNFDEKAMEAVVADSRRMSIHDPSPPVRVSPEKLSNGMVPAQFSPYITSARGKDKYSLQKRRSSLIPVVPEIHPEELVKSRQVEHFRNLLERESSRLLTLSALWQERLEEAPPAAQDKILGPVGQARLLVNDKFQQFRRLVDNFEGGDHEGKITADDLTGFWEMMLLTVENVDKRFQELEDLKRNHWQEHEEEVVQKMDTVAPAVPKPLKPRTQAQSRIKDIIEASRKRKQEMIQKKSANNSTFSGDVTSFDGGFFKVESPRKLLPSPKIISRSPAPRSPKVKLNTPHQHQRRSLLQQVLTYSAVRAQKSPYSSPLNKSLPLSPSPKVALAQMRASQLGKRMSLGSSDDSFSQDSFTHEPSSPVLKPEPSKSILKSGGRKVNALRNKVAFELLSSSTESSPGSLQSPATPPNLTPLQLRTATPGSRRRASLIPRLVQTPKGDRPSLMPMRESVIPTKPLPNGELIDFSTP